MISDERFFAWLDGELAAAEAAEIDALVAADPELRRRAAAHRQLREKVRAAFDPVVAGVVPERLLRATARTEAEVIELDSRRAGARPIMRPAQWAAMAATLAIGIVAGSLLGSAPSGPIAREDGQLVASGELEEALYTRLASAPADQGARIGLTFRDAAGDVCRSFTDAGSSGVACHKGGDWRIRGLLQAGESQQSEFRMAAGTDPRLAELVDSTMAGEPLDAAGEKRALEELK